MFRKTRIKNNRIEPLYSGSSRLQYDHHDCPGVVPRTFVGSLIVALTAAPLVAAFEHSGHKFWSQYIGECVRPSMAAHSTERIQLWTIPAHSSTDSGRLRGDCLDKAAQHTATDVRRRGRLVVHADHSVAVPFHVLHESTAAEYVGHAVR